MENQSPLFVICALMETQKSRAAITSSSRHLSICPVYLFRTQSTIQLLTAIYSSSNNGRYYPQRGALRATWAALVRRATPDDNPMCERDGGTERHQLYPSHHSDKGYNLKDVWSFW